MFRCDNNLYTLQYLLSVRVDDSGKVEESDADDDDDASDIEMSDE